jgi:NAD(P)-dependent dehydrogenase (short-subunit alcohol dehydrogenase family)
MTRIAIITGGSSGIGYGTALALAARGIDSLVTWNRNAAGMEELVAAVNAAGARAVPLRLDLGNAAGFASFAAEAAATVRREWRVERFDYLVNNGGVSDMAPFESTTEAQFDGLFRVLLKGPYFLTQALLPRLADGGAIVNVTSSSVHPTSVSPGFSAYATMKGGLTTLTRYLAKELAPRRIRVNSIAPGPTRTRLGDDGFARFPDLIAPLVARTALGRLGEAADIGSAIAALLSDDCRWVTGQDVEVSGGFGM